MQLTAESGKTMGQILESGRVIEKIEECYGKSAAKTVVSYGINFLKITNHLKMLSRKNLFYLLIII